MRKIFGTFIFTTALPLILLAGSTSWASALVQSTLYSNIPQEEITKLVSEFGGTKAGEKELGEAIRGRPYYHFFLDENRKEELFAKFEQFGNYTWELSESSRTLAPGKMRVILWLSPEQNGKTLFAYQSVGINAREQKLDLSANKKLENKIRDYVTKNGSLTFFRNPKWQGKKIQVRLKADEKSVRSEGSGVNVLWMPLAGTEQKTLTVNHKDFQSFFVSSVKEGTLTFLSVPDKNQPWTVKVQPLNLKQEKVAVVPTTPAVHEKLAKKPPFTTNYQDVLVDQLPPFKTYSSTLRWHSYQNEEVHHEEFGPLMTDETKEFPSELTKGNVSITRYRSTSVSLQGSVVPAKPTPAVFGFLSARKWLEQPWGSSYASSPLYQHTGLLLDIGRSFSSDKELALTQYRLAMVYRWHHEIERKDAGFYLGPALKYLDVNIGKPIVAGLSGGYEFPFPQWANASVEWLPFMRYPKYMTLRGEIYPWTLNNYKDLDSNYAQWAAKMYVTENLFLEASVAYTLEHSKKPDGSQVSNVRYTSFAGGLGYVF